MSMVGSDPAPIQPMLDALRAEKITIVELREVRQSLEELFMESVGEAGVGGAQKRSAPPQLPVKELAK